MVHKEKPEALFENHDSARGFVTSYTGKMYQTSDDRNQKCSKDQNLNPSVVFTLGDFDL